MTIIQDGTFRKLIPGEGKVLRNRTFDEGFETDCLFVPESATVDQYVEDWEEIDVPDGAGKDENQDNRAICTE